MSLPHHLCWFRNQRESSLYSLSGIYKSMLPPLFHTIPSLTRNRPTIFPPTRHAPHAFHNAQYSNNNNKFSYGSKCDKATQPNPRSGAEKNSHHARSVRNIVCATHMLQIIRHSDICCFANATSIFDKGISRRHRMLYTSHRIRATILNK